MKIGCVGAIVCLVALSCTREWDNPYDSKVEPTAPGGLKAVALNDSTIELTWEDSQDEIGYKIERGIDGGPLQEIGSVAQNGTRFVDGGLRIDDHRYSYRVRAFAANGKEAYTDDVNFTLGETIMVLPGGATMEMVWIKPGTFLMGSPEDEPGRENDEGPQHEVTVSRGFWLGKYELTQAQWESVMGTRPWSGMYYVWEKPDHPAVCISWDDMRTFIAKLNKAKGSEVYRLPTEAEWEYACRAGTTTRWSFGDDESLLGNYAWYDANAWYVGKGYAHAVGTKLPNPWGLYDMHGNVYEWVQDWYGSYFSDPQADPTGPTSGSDRVERGGCFGAGTQYARSAYRTRGPLGHRYYSIGARLLRQGP